MRFSTLNLYSKEKDHVGTSRNQQPAKVSDRLQRLRLAAMRALAIRHPCLSASDFAVRGKILVVMSRIPALHTSQPVSSPLMLLFSSCPHMILAFQYKYKGLLHAFTVASALCLMCDKTGRSIFLS